MSDFVVTEAMLRHIAEQAMGLVEVPDDGEPIAPGCYSVEGSTLYGSEWLWHLSNGLYRDETAQCLLMWLVRERKWVLCYLGRELRGVEYFCALHRDYDALRSGHVAAPTLCEAIMRAILAATGWEGEP